MLIKSLSVKTGCDYNECKYLHEELSVKFQEGS